MNQNQKGKRVEREVVNWLKDNGFQSAHRSQQYCGKAGDADILCSELEVWHIESKGTKSPTLTRSQLLKWWEQIHADGGSKLKVIINKANNKDFVAILPYDNFTKIQDLLPSVYSTINVLPAFRPADILTETNAYIKVDYITGGGIGNSIPVIYYGLDTEYRNLVFVFMWGKDWLECAKAIVKGISLVA